MKNRKVLLFLTYLLSIPLLLIGRESSYPYVSGDTFRAFCDYIFDETGNTIIPEKVTYGDIIFLKTDYLASFFLSIHPLIATPYVLVTHNSDYPAPGAFEHMLDDPKLLAWFGQNIEASHPKLHPIPIGVANRYWGHGNIGTISDVQGRSNTDRDFLLYLNFSINTYPQERRFVYQLFKDRPFCTVSRTKDFRSYLVDVKHAKFVLSPRGNGLDCHRTWEALYMGAIPVVMHSTLDPVFEGLPVLLIKDWNEVTQDFLEAKWNEMACGTYCSERIYADYWLNLISSYKNREG